MKPEKVVDLTKHSSESGNGIGRLWLNTEPNRFGRLSHSRPNSQAMNFTSEDIKRLVMIIGAGLLVRFLWAHSAFNENENPHRKAIVYAYRSLPSGVAGIEETLRHMAAMVRYSAHDPAVRDFALRVVHEVAGHDFAGEIARCFEFVRDRVSYRRDPVGVERIQDARRTIVNFGSGDCDDKVVLLASLLATLGHKCRFVVCGFSPDDYSHVYLQVFSAGSDRTPGWLSLDPTVERARPGWQADAPHRAAYNIFD